MSIDLIDLTTESDSDDFADTLKSLVGVPGSVSAQACYEFLVHSSMKEGEIEKCCKLHCTDDDNECVSMCTDILGGRLNHTRSQENNKNKRINREDDRHKLMNCLEKISLEVDEDFVRNDGNCLFDTISYSNLVVKNKKTVTKELVQKHSKELRKACVDWVRENKNEPYRALDGDGYVTMSAVGIYDSNSETPTENINQYLKRMKKDRQWGDERMLLAAANVLNLNIEIISHGNTYGICPPRHQQISPVVFEFEDFNKKKRKAPQNKITIGHIGETHYVATRPIGSIGNATVMHVDILE